MVKPEQAPEYPAHWEADVVLRDGATGHLRPMTAADADAVQAFHMAQSQNSIYMRFFTYKSKLTPKELRRFTELDYRDRVAFVITHGREIIGIGRYDRLDDPAEAEVAFNVSDANQGRGLGSILLEHLAVAARENGIDKFSAEVLPENRKMMQVFTEAGYEVHRRFDDGVISLSFDIDPTEKSRAVMEAREHRADARSVAGLLAPASVAVIGASRAWGSIGQQLLEHIVEGGFTGAVHAVNQEALEVSGMMPYGSIAEVPGPVDLAVIAVPYDQVPSVVEQCGAAGVKGLVIATAGFADDGEHGLARQRALVRSARANGMRLVGPASLGLANTDPAVSLNASMAPELPLRGGLGIFSQSAALGVSLFASMSRRSVGMSSVLSAGNRADISGNDMMQFWEDDPNTTACGLYLESIGNPRKFSRISRRLSRTKPVIVAKSDAMGLHLPPGHVVRTTQAPAGALDAMLRQSGVVRVNTIEELSDVAQILVGQPLPQGPGLAIIGNSGALGTVVADAAEQNGLKVAAVESMLSLDTGQSRALPLLRRTVLGALAREGADSAIVTLLPVIGLTIDTIARTLQECSEESGKPVIGVFTGIVDARIHVNRQMAGTLPAYSSPGAAIAALAAVARYAKWRTSETPLFDPPEGVDPEAAQELLDGWLEGVSGDGLQTLDPAQAAELLGHYGISILESVPFGSDDEAVAAAERLGWPVAIKTLDPSLRHRLDLGGVRINIENEQSLRRNIGQMRKFLQPYGEKALEVQSMAEVGQSCTLRAIEDPLLGPVVSFGMSGDAVSLLDDWAHRVPPLSVQDTAELVRSPRAARKLFGYEGLPAVNVAALEDLAARVAMLKDEHPEVAFLEFKPVLAGPTKVTVLAVDLRIGNPAQRTDSARRALNS
ncbi:acyl-CoA synthetase (NDP forming)/GNAT superfamily N-acetyltransferase [Arthrobacter stackebrandtii]|uniref:Acyl-CoA synthetase (NDP forming)/GNAT superfamily N-acetyltransferase n=1 Tax=Arthrobacter stackebrandtii TaxID=272161 RepID=A0ABS4Z1J1_9MICC|nr:GNAT family N-acetyltransferase [Arthrobacter stackebrandtii]MBP2414917.1 acyl-CoA synthetase (NDP forming)/GNAT superfamily N-acetyltransferase [Arthrobacter stackebrandtii]PYH00916.1 GNAT family N-acetyltransferase [Arthrobacter stackebrandtii]